MTAELAREDPDVLVAAAAPGLAPPAVRHHHVVLVTGPWLAGVSCLAAALRNRLEGWPVVESADLPSGVVPTAIVFAVSAVAPLAESDCVSLDTAGQHTDLVIGALTKIDVHRDWRAALAANADAVRGRSARYRAMAWVGVAAAPDDNRPQLDELVALLRSALADTSLPRRNRLRVWETHLSGQINAQTADGTAAALHAERDAHLRNGRLTRAEHTGALRGRIRQARVQLGYFARNRCASVRSEMSEDASRWGGLPLPGRRRADDFERYVHERAAQILAEVDAGITDQLRDIAAELDLPRPRVPSSLPMPDLGAPGLTSRRLEMQLMMLLGTGFGLGVALAASRLFAGLGSGLTVAGLAAGGVIGLILTIWVVGIRGLLHDRALLDRWVGEVTGTLRAATDALVATRVLQAEEALTGEATARDEAAAQVRAQQLDVIDARLRVRAVAAARVYAAHQRRLPALQAALAVVRAELADR